MEAAMLALAMLLQADCHIDDREAVDLTVMNKRWQMVLDCLGAEQPPCSQVTLFSFCIRLIAHHLDKTRLDRIVALTEKTGGFGVWQLRAGLDSTPLFGAGRVEDTKNNFILDFADRQVPCPGGQTVSLVPGQSAQFPATACGACALRIQGTKAPHGQGRSVSTREDEPFQQKLRAKMKTRRGQAALRKRTAVEHTIGH